jgi:hypothetical protein
MRLKMMRLEMPRIPSGESTATLCDKAMVSQDRE